MSKSAMDDVLLGRVRAEFLEMPGLMLTAPQLERLCGLDRSVGQRVIDHLVETRFLFAARNGRYGRLHGGEIARQHAPRSFERSRSAVAQQTPA